MKHAPIIGFLILMIVLGVFSLFVDQESWARGTGDYVLIVLGVFTVGLVVWEKRLQAKKRRQEEKNSN